MKAIRKLHLTVGLLVTAIGLASSPVVSAQIIGISVNFDGANGTLNSGDVAGVVPLSNWNNVNSTVQWGLDTFSGLIDSTGASVAMTFSAYIGYATSGGGNSGPNSGDAKMLGGGFAYGSGGGTISITNIPYASYSLYVYVGPDSAYHASDPNFNGSITVGSTTYYYQNLANSSTYVQSVDTTGPSLISSQADYVLFTGLTGSSLDFIVNAPNWNNTGVYGFQIVESAVPEPSTYVLLMFGVLALVGVGYRAKRGVVISL